MKRSYFLCKITCTTLILLHYSIIHSIGQNKSIPLQRIIFKDKVLEGNLNGFVSKAKAKVVLVILEQRDNAYLYKLAGVNFYERVKKYPKIAWGKWRNHIIIFNSNQELKNICTISDTTDFDNLLHYIRPFVADIDKPLKSSKTQPDLSIPAEGLEWTFKVENGKEVWLYDNYGYDSRDIISVPVSN